MTLNWSILQNYTFLKWHFPHNQNNQNNWPGYHLIKKLIKTGGRPADLLNQPDCLGQSPRPHLEGAARGGRDQRK